MPSALLNGRAILNVTGEEAESFLQNLITTDLDNLQRGKLRPGALLSPQGKIMFEFLDFTIGLMACVSTFCSL